MPRLLQLEGTSLEELKARVLAEHGTRARVIAVEQVTTGGIHGFFGHRHFEVTVEVLDSPEVPLHYGQVHEAPVSATPWPASAPPAAPTAPAAAAAQKLPAKHPAAAQKLPKIGLDALLDGADDEDTVSYSVPDDGFPVSTSSREFANILDELESVTAPVVATQPHRPLPVPKLLAAAGDMVLVVGLGTDALTVARTMSRSVGKSELAASGALDSPGLARLTDRRDALLARARGVERNETLFVAAGITSGGVHASAQATALAQLRADQVWVVVDASRKPDDTARWVRKVSSIVQLDAVVGIQREGTTTPETVNALGLPVSWEYGN
ncbi:MAG: hypothetical protein ABI053_06890 [Lacisediminihabitans sp.]